MARDGRTPVDPDPTLDHAAVVARAHDLLKVMEGELCNSTSNCPGGTPACNSPLFTDPIYTYPHSGANSGCSITGGFVYRGCAIPDLQGSYFFADWCAARSRPGPPICSTSKKPTTAW